MVNHILYLCPLMYPVPSLIAQCWPLFLWNSSWTFFHQDGNGTVDSGHQCLTGRNHVIMLRRLNEADKKRAMRILGGDLGKGGDQGAEEGMTGRFPVRAATRAGAKASMAIGQSDQALERGERLVYYCRRRHAQL